MSNRTGGGVYIGRLGESVPRVHPDAVLLPGAMVIGDVSIAAYASIWFGAVLRGDSGRIKVGERSNIQDNCVVHGSAELAEDVLVGHGCILHDVRIETGVVIGAGSLLLPGTIVERGAFVAAGSLVSPRTRLPEGSYSRGRPARVVGSTNELSHLPWLDDAASYYTRLASRYMLELDGVWY